MFPDEPTDEERQEQLPQDNETPFRPASPNPDPAGATNPVTQAQDDSRLDDTHPATDTNVQPEEQYDEGISGAAEAQEPNAGNAVTNYAPQSDDLRADEDGQGAATAASGDGTSDEADTGAGSDSDNQVTAG